MNTPNLNHQNIEVADLCKFRPNIRAGQLFLVYAPLAGVSFLSDADNIAKLEAEISQKSESLDQSVAELLNQLLDTSEANLESRIVTSPLKYTKLSILPNLICNFSCTYCYSAKGRSKSEVSQDNLRLMLDFFIDRKRVDTKNLTIFISGGGEPVISWEKVRFVIEYGRERAQKEGFNLELLLMTNGSLITPEIADFLKEQQVQVGISFEILPEIQQTQRGKYELVKSNILMMLERGLSPSISSVITPQNVYRMEEMVRVVINEFTGIRHLNFDPAMSNELFADEVLLDVFYQRFIDHFFKAKKLSGEHHITLDCNVVRRAEKLFPRYCQGKLCLVPNGDISICHTISSPQEIAYDDYIYGKLTADGPVFDEQKFHQLIDVNHILLPNCETCIARWHCAGGCMMYKRNYDEKKFLAVCRFTEKMIGTILLAKLDTAYKEQHHQGIDRLLSEYMIK